MPDDVLTFDDVQAQEDAALGSPKERAALCLSGGGIRSATFSLGVIQGLARCGVLDQFHYLSTVSGGGYIGSWLSAWVQRKGLPAVVAELKKTPGTEAEPAPVQHLRAYSNYLSPRLGLFSADTWTLAATMMRNMVLNWTLLIPLLAAVLLIPRLCVALAVAVARLDPPAWVTEPLLFLGSLCAVVAIAYVQADLPSAGDGLGRRQFVRGCLAPLAASAVLLTLYWFWRVQSLRPVPHRLGWFVWFGMGLHFTGWAVGVWEARRRRRSEARPRNLWIEAPMVAAAGALGGALLWLVVNKVVPTTFNPELYVCLASPILLGLYLAASTFYVGLIGNSTTEEDREWFARAGALILIVGMGWLVFSALALLGPWALRELGEKVQAAIAAAGGLLGLAAGLFSALAGHSDKTSPGPEAAAQRSKADVVRDLALKLAAPASALLLLAALAWGTDRLVAALNTEPLSELAAVSLVLVLLLAVSLVMAFFININRFSLHAMYRNRLIRAYPGASHSDRQPHPFTLFDPADNLRMHRLPAGRLLHVVNITLNLVKGARLAWQQRKAESFTVSPLHSGSFDVGYRTSGDYGGAQPYGRGQGKGITLGTAVAISGAAASPNMGYHSSPVVTFLMTLFNARLGWWLGNPGSAGAKTWKRSGPGFALLPMLDEAFGLTTDRSPYVYLSDGGHFENLGLYEMVRRRCRWIVVADASCDPKYQFDDLANAVRKIRIDQRISIEFEKMAIDPKLGESGSHCAIGTIHYSEKEKGKLLYIKPVVMGGEPADVRNYAAANEPFPHQTTADQWFDESQFESYRMLGQHSVESICPDAAGLTLDQLFHLAAGPVPPKAAAPAAPAKLAAAANP